MFSWWKIMMHLIGTKGNIMWTLKTP